MAPRVILHVLDWWATVDGSPIRCVRGEVEMLALLLRRPGRVITREVAMDAIASLDSGEAFDRAIDNRVKLVRRRLRAAGLTDAVLTAYAVGYQWNRDVPALLIETEAQADAWAAAGGVASC